MAGTQTPVTTKYAAFADFQSSEHSSVRCHHLMTLYREAAYRDSPLILELGTNKGNSTTAFLQACQEQGGHLVSVDIADCSDVTDSHRWVFVQCDSTDVATVLSHAHQLAQGIDVLYIDSAHRWKHVRNEVYSWFPHLNHHSTVLLDDVDAAPYRRGQRKDNIIAERNVDMIHKFVKAFFYSNIDSTRLDILYGSTGLARVYKYSPYGTMPRAVEWSYVRQRKPLSVGGLSSDLRRARRLAARISRVISNSVAR
jgi:predicted O-methyltransferase YrrM